jgi:Carboxypeptidase regulatory-like domain/TonB dependent receptor
MSKRRQTVAGLLILMALVLGAAGTARAQSTATLQGTVSDSQNAILPGVTITITNTATGVERTAVTDVAGQYVAASLTPGAYRVVARLQGFSDQTTDVTLEVAQIAVVNIKLGIAAVAETVTVTGASPVIETATVSVGQVMAERTVQEIPLNGRHFVDLGPLMPGGVTPPQNSALSAPLRGQGSFSFFSAGNRETSVNLMINGINLNDLSNSQVTFQPSINTVSEFKVDNSTFSAEYGRNSGAIVNVATRSGANTFHGEGFDFYRDDSLDSRNYFNPEPNPKSPFNRKQFGVNTGGPVVKNKVFFFYSYEGLRHTQGVDLNANVLTDAQRAAVTNPVSRNLLAYIPAGNTFDANGQARLLASGTAPVNIDQHTIDMHYAAAKNDNIHGYYAYQKDLRQEPNAQGNTIPGFGDTRGGKRQVMTFNETHIFTPALVNEARAGYNRINISFTPLVQVNPTTLGINDGINIPIGMPQITITGLGLNFGGPAGFPQGRTVTTWVGSDTATYLKGNHIFKFGGEYRRASVESFTQDTGTFTYPSLAAFQSGVGNQFIITLGDRASTIIIPAVGAFVQDSITVGPKVKLDLGLRYDYIGSPSEPTNNLVVFDAASDSLVRLGSGIDQIHKNASDFQPRVGVIWTPSSKSDLAVRGAYAVMINQTNTGYVVGSASNPPLAVPLNVAGNVTLENALATAQASGLAPSTTNPNFLPGRMQTWNVNVEKQFGATGMMVGYFGSYGDRQRIPVNINQFINGVRPYPRLSATSPISPGATLGNITEVQSVGWSHYKGLWITANRRMSKGLQVSSSYTLSKSTDTNSYDATGANTNGSLQDSYNLLDSYGPSDFDTRHRFSLNGTYELPFRGNRLKDGWQVTGVLQFQSGNPVNIITTLNTLTGVTSLRPDLVGDPSIIGSANQWFNNAVCDPRIAAPAAGSCNSSSVFALPVSPSGVLHFGNIPRNLIYGPGFSDVDLSLIKNVNLVGPSRLQLRVEVFNLFNTANFGQPGRTAALNSSSFGVIPNTRFPTGDSGSARQVQFALKVLF